MKIYHTKTQEDYDALMDELGNGGFYWAHGVHAKNENIWFEFKEETCIGVDSIILGYDCIDFYKTAYPNDPIVEYTAPKSHDNVNNPAHYTQGELEVIDILKDKLTKEEFEGFLKGNILKYTFRENIKNGTEDMKKAAWYTAKLISFREG